MKPWQSELDQAKMLGDVSEYIGPSQEELSRQRLQQMLADQALQDTSFDMIPGGKAVHSAGKGAAQLSTDAGKAWRKSVKNSRGKGLESKTRRGVNALLGTGGAMALHPKQAAFDYANRTGGAVAFGTEGTGLGSLLGSIVQSTANKANDIAMARHYRMGKVAGDPSVEATAKTYLANRVQPYINAFDTANQLASGNYQGVRGKADAFQANAFRGVNLLTK